MHFSDIGHSAILRVRLWRLNAPSSRVVARRRSSCALADDTWLPSQATAPC